MQANKIRFIIEGMMVKSLRKPWAVVVAMLLLAGHTAFARQLSPDAEISILTFGPGEKELYSAFGHSAIRVYDPANGFDVAYNYGTFDFNQPNFYLNFARGYLIYKLSVQDYRRLKAYYEYNNRSITEQVLDLSREQKQKVFNYLQNNARPENANYYYDYFYDNCATKIGDVFVAALGDEFKFNEDFVEEPGLTIRTLTDRYSAVYFPWGKLGIDLCLGMPMDKQLTNMQYTYLPDYVFKAFARAEVKRAGSWRPVVRSTKQIYIADQENKEPPLFTPKLVFWSLWVIVLAASVLAYRKGFSWRWFDFIYFFTVGFIGLFLLLLWLATDHAAAAWNLNLLWAWPTHLVAAVFLLKKPRPRWVNWYLLATVFLGVLLLILWPFLPQALNYGLVPIVAIIITRSLVMIIE